MVFEMKLGLVGVVCSGVVDTKFIINNGWVEDFIKITIRVFDFLFRESQGIIKLSTREIKIPTLKTVRDEI